MKCPKCSFEVSDSADECLRCGLIFSKYKKTKRPTVTAPQPNKSHDDEESQVMALLLSVKPGTDHTDFMIRCVFFILFFIWSLFFLFSSIRSPAFGAGFWHLVNLPFHEAGHLIFRPFGRVITSLGGTLGQIMMPMICMAVFLVKTRDGFAASFCLWWTAENFIDIAPYIDDARRLTMPLIGGNTGQTSPYGFHDWEFILTETNLISHNHTLAALSHGVGLALMILSIIWGIAALKKIYTVIA